MPLPDEQQNAYDLMQQMLTDWGLESLSSTVYDLLVQGYSQDNVSVLLRDTDAYKQRFKGNQLRKQAGLAVLSPAEYLSVERSYRQLLRTSGIPEGFWDQQDDFTQLIAKDVSPMELQRRVDISSTIASNIDENSRAYFHDTYGLDFSSLDRGQLTAYVMDADRGMDVINRALKGGRIAGAARGRGVALSQAQAEQFGAAADLNQLDQQAAQYADVASRGGFLAGLYNGQYDAQRAGEDVFLGDTAAEQERIRLQKAERATFAGAGSSTQNALGQGPGGF